LGNYWLGREKRGIQGFKERIIGENWIVPGFSNFPLTWVNFVFKGRFPNFGPREKDVKLSFKSRGKGNLRKGRRGERLHNWVRHWQGDWGNLGNFGNFGSLFAN